MWRSARPVVVVRLGVEVAVVSGVLMRRPRSAGPQRAASAQVRPDREEHGPPLLRGVADDALEGPGDRGGRRGGPFPAGSVGGHIDAVEAADVPPPASSAGPRSRRWARRSRWRAAPARMADAPAPRTARSMCRRRSGHGRRRARRACRRAAPPSVHGGPPATRRSGCRPRRASGRTRPELGVVERLHGPDRLADPRRQEQGRQLDRTEVQADEDRWSPRPEGVLDGLGRLDRRGASAARRRRWPASARPRGNSVPRAGRQAGRDARGHGGHGRRAGRAAYRATSASSQATTRARLRRACAARSGVARCHRSPASSASPTSGASGRWHASHEADRMARPRSRGPRRRTVS